MKELQIFVCIKQVPDPEGPADAFRIDEEARRVVAMGVPPVINPFDENALEAALRIKDIHHAKVIAISVGDKLAQPVLKKALAAGADNLMLAIDSHFRDVDNFSTAYILSSVIRRIGRYDLILMGRQASDWNFGVTGSFLAAILNLPAIHLARKVEIEKELIRVERLCDYGYEIVKGPLPALVTVSNELGELRYASVRSLQAANKQRATVFNAEDLNLEVDKLKKRVPFKLSIFNEKRECKFIEGRSQQEKGENLALRIRADGLI